MKSKILISINPEHVNNIINGTKRYEYRRKKAKKELESIVIYETSPIKKVVGEVEVKEVLECSPKILWDMTKKESGITKKFFDEYFTEIGIAYAYKLGKVTIYDEPKQLEDYGVKSAPQSFIYL